MLLDWRMAVVWGLGHPGGPRNPSSISCRSGNCSGWPGDLVPDPLGSILGPGRGLLVPMGSLGGSRPPKDPGFGGLPAPLTHPPALG